jgi:hypothetical protein
MVIDWKNTSKFKYLFNTEYYGMFRLYCRYDYDEDNRTSFKSREEELRHFLNRISQKNNSWNKWPPPRFYSESYNCKYEFIFKKMCTFSI